MKLPEHDRPYDPRSFSQQDEIKVEGLRANIAAAQHIGDRVWEAQSLYSIGCILQTYSYGVVEAIGSIEKAIGIFRQEHEVQSYYQASLNLAAIYENRIQDKRAAFNVYKKAMLEGAPTVEGTAEDTERKYILHHVERMQHELSE